MDTLEERIALLQDGEELTDLDLAGANLERIEVKGAVLERVNLQGAVLGGASFSDCLYNDAD
jgi:uncharacterized protein YjbI with pentapeptide repeats